MFSPIPTTDQSMPLAVVRCKPGEPLRVVIACPAIRGVRTHYINSQTIVHRDGPNCPGCEQNMEPRWQGYTIVSNPGSGRHALLCFTPPVALVIEANLKGGGLATGMDITLSRLGRRPNSPLMCRVNGFVDLEKVWSPSQLEGTLRRLFSDEKKITMDCLKSA